MAIQLTLEGNAYAFRFSPSDYRHVCGSPRIIYRGSVYPPPHAEPPSFVPNCKVAHLASGPLGHLFQLRPVFAESCSMTPCSGHYLVLDIYDCCPAWGGFIPFYYSDPEASYSSGYYYTGGVNCPHCPSGGCTESGCQNP